MRLDDPALLRPRPPPVTVLFAVGDHGRPVLARTPESDDDLLAELIADNSPDMTVIYGPGKLPDDNGLYLWTGTVRVEDVGHPLDPPEYDAVWRGAWRPATAADLATFGFAAPPP